MMSGPPQTNQKTVLTSARFRRSVAVPPPNNVRRAMVYGAAMGSYAVEQFGIRGFEGVSLSDVESRVRAFQDLTHVSLAQALV